MNTKRFFLPLLLIVIAGFCGQTSAKQRDLTSFVNPRIGSGAHGHVFVGADVPYGMVNVGPVSIPQTWDWCSGYHDSDSTVIGFALTRISGTGCVDLGDLPVMPVVGKVKYSRGEENDPASGLWSYADRTKEVVRPGYYSVPLLRYGITAEMTATCHVALQRFTFPESEQSAIVIDGEDAIGDEATEVRFEKVGDNAIQGWRYSRGWAQHQRVYFYAEFSRLFEQFSLEGKGGSFCRVGFRTKSGEKILMKIGISAVSVEGAKANMAAELPGWNFNAVMRAAGKAWNQELSRIEIESSDPDIMKTFYTAMYHTMIHPTTFSDCNGDYRGADDKVHHADHKTYTVFSLWDTYRAQLPLFTFMDPARYSDFVNTMLDISDEQGKLPVWHLWGNETNTMVGNPAIVAVSDAVVKNIPGFDKERAFKVMKASAMLTERGQGARQKYGYMPCEAKQGSLAEDMEDALADGALAKAAETLGKAEDARFFTERSHSYRNYFDPSTLFMRGKHADGSWVSPFSPYYSDHFNSVYTEGNAWQYTWLVPQDLPGLVNLYGSKEKTIERLDSLFLASTKVTGANASPDISGMIGQYVHGNEPSHHIIYFYTMLGQPYKTADKVREVLSTLYGPTDEGISGNEDAGQMSAWYILSALGFYQVEPAGARYWFGSPVVDEAQIKVPGGIFKIIARNNSKENKYIQKVTLNGKPYDKLFIDYPDIVKGGELVFEMGSEKCEL